MSVRSQTAEPRYRAFTYHNLTDTFAYRRRLPRQAGRVYYVGCNQPQAVSLPIVSPVLGSLVIGHMHPDTGSSRGCRDGWCDRERCLALGTHRRLKDPMPHRSGKHQGGSWITFRFTVIGVSRC